MHPLFMLKSAGLPPLNLREEKCRGALPELVIVMFCCGLVVASATPENETAAEERVTAGRPPVPVSWAVCGELGASSAIVSVAVRVPRAEGANITATVHAAPAA